MSKPLYQGDEPYRPQDRFITDLIRDIEEASRLPVPRLTLLYSGKSNLLNATSLKSALRQALPDDVVAWIVPPYQVTRTRELLGGIGRMHRPVFSGAESTHLRTIQDLKDDNVHAVVLYRLFPAQHDLFLEQLSQRLPNLLIISVIDKTLEDLPRSDTRTVLPRNRISLKTAERYRTLAPYVLTNPRTLEEFSVIPTIVKANPGGRPHCRLCGTIIQGNTDCVRYEAFTPGMPVNVKAPQVQYLHAFDCTRPNQVLYIDSAKGYAVLTNDQGKPVETRLGDPRFDPKTQQITYNLLDLPPQNR